MPSRQIKMPAKNEPDEEVAEVFSQRKPVFRGQTRSFRDVRCPANPVASFCRLISW
jgi:hypothetical protein